MLTTTIDFVQSDYNSNMPIFGTKGNYNKRLKFANKTATLPLGNTDYGYGVYTISFTGPVNYVSISFLDSDGANVSVSTEQDSLYRIANKNNDTTALWEYVLKNDSYIGVTTFYVIVNGDSAKKTDRLNVLIAMGKRGIPPLTSSVSITCDCAVPLYKYEAGVHVYSDYDAIGSISKLRTELFSRIPIESWTINTPIYAGAFFENPAQPYYYGIDDKVYKVGGRYDRSYGTQTQITTKKKLFGKMKTSTETFGPKLWYDPNPVNETSDACTMPFFEGVGKIRGIVNSSSLVQPQLYRYYLGYNSSVKRQSNDSVFTQYSFATQSHNPIVGATHALNKLLTGLAKGFRRDLVINDWVAAGSILGLALLIPIGQAAGGNVAGAIAVWFTGGSGPLVPTGYAVSASSSGWFLTLIVNPWFWIVLGIIILIIIFSVKTKRYREPCKKFLHHFTNKPYIEVSTEEDDTILYKNAQLSIVNNGYYCDGVYYYEQSGGKITSKELSYTNAIVNDNPVQFKFQYSIQADSPTLVVNYNKLTVLAYTSGKPLPFCNGTIYYNNQSLTQTISPNCCDLETATETIISIENESEYSCISQQDANDKAQAIFDAAVDYALNYANYCSPFDDDQLGVLNSYFTHELKIETIPTETTVYYNSTLGDAVLGTTLYYDNAGCQKVLDGYYGVTGSTIYRTFYHTTNGDIDVIYYMQNSNSTTTTTGQPIITTGLNYSSNWFYTDSNAETLTYMTNYYNNETSFNPNSLYSDVQMKKGFIDNLTTLDDFQIYDSFVGPTYSEAPSGWYRPLVDWISNDPFYYYLTETITLNIDEYCGGVTTRGFFITGLVDGIPTTTTNPVQMEIEVYVKNVGLSATYTATTSDVYNSTFVNYGSQINSGEVVSAITITSILSPNPLNKTTYVVGDTSLCRVTGLEWDLSTNTSGFTGCQMAGWVVTNNNLSIRFNVAPSSLAPCTGTCGIRQLGTAIATITVGDEDTFLDLNFNGLGEAQDANYDKMFFYLDNVLLADGHAPGGGKQCVDEPIITTYAINPPYLLLANTVYVFRIEFDTVDAQFHIESFYQVNLSFSGVTPTPTSSGSNGG